MGAPWPRKAAHSFLVYRNDGHGHVHSQCPSTRPPPAPHTHSLTHSLIHPLTYPCTHAHTHTTLALVPAPAPFVPVPNAVQAKPQMAIIPVPTRVRPQRLSISSPLDAPTRPPFSSLSRPSHSPTTSTTSTGQPPASYCSQSHPRSFVRTPTHFSTGTPNFVLSFSDTHIYSTSKCSVLSVCRRPAAATRSP